MKFPNQYRKPYSVKSVRKLFCYEHQIVYDEMTVIYTCGSLSMAADVRDAMNTAYRCGIIDAISASMIEESLSKS